jgi:hypothetical protein
MSSVEPKRDLAETFFFHPLDLSSNRTGKLFFVALNALTCIATLGLSHATYGLYYLAKKYMFSKKEILTPSDKKVNETAQNNLTQSPQRVINILNKEKPTFEDLLSIITKETCDFPIFVAEPGESRGKKKYSIATLDQIKLPSMPQWKNRMKPEPKGTFNHTTTLSNIVATNELKFTIHEVHLLLKKLIEVGADFSAVDHTNYQGDTNFPCIQNDPLKSILALVTPYRTAEEDGPECDVILNELVDHIGTLDKEIKKKILTHEDRYPLGNINPISFLIREGKEDIAVKLVKMDSPVTERDLYLACSSFGSTSMEKPEGKTLIPELLKKFPFLTPATKKKCLTALDTKKITIHPDIHDEFRLNRDYITIKKAFAHTPEGALFFQQYAQMIQEKPEQVV